MLPGERLCLDERPGHPVDAPPAFERHTDAPSHHSLESASQSQDRQLEHQMTARRPLAQAVGDSEEATGSGSG